MKRALALLLLLGAAPQERKPNVLLVITDDQGYGDLGAHGNAKIRTPHLDAFARASARVDRFYVSPVCSPTRASLLTGRYPYRTGVVDTYLGRSMMHADEVTLAERLGAEGWRTGIFGKWHLGDCHPLRAIDQGFGTALTLKGGGLGQPSDPPGGDRYQDPTLYRNGKPEKTKGYVTDVITEGALGFIEANRERPFFAYVAYNAPHTPLEVPEGSAKEYLDAGLDDVTAKVYAMVTNVDANVGRLLAKLDVLKVADDTIVIFLTDNGPQQARYNAGMRGLKTTVFEGGIRVPFYLRWPRAVRAGTVVKEIAAHIDVMPTVLDACGVASPEARMDGVSLLPALKGGTLPGRTLFTQWHRGDAPVEGRACAVIEQRWKWMRPDSAKRGMLFDLLADPGERTDVAAAFPAEAERLAGAYAIWFADVVSTRGFAPPRIRIGTEHENPVVLTRQDWRGPKAGWAKDSIGHWEVEVATAGLYDIKVHHAAGAAVWLDLLGVTVEEERAVIQGKEGPKVTILERIRLKAEVGRIESFAPLNQVEIRRLE